MPSTHETPYPISSIYVQNPQWRFEHWAWVEWILPKDMSTSNKWSNTPPRWKIIDKVYSNSFKIYNMSLRLQGFNATTSASRCWRNHSHLLVTNGKMHATFIMIYHGKMLSWWRIFKWFWNLILPHTINCCGFSPHSCHPPPTPSF
jgi:hypothetical protein